MSERGFGDRGDRGDGGGNGERAGEHDDRGILDSVRRILATDASQSPADGRPTPGGHEIFDLDPATIVEPAEPAPTPFRAAAEPARPAPSTRVPAAAASFRRDEPRARAEPSPVSDHAVVGDAMVGDAAGRDAGQAFASLRTAFRDKASVAVHRGGPTIEDLVREELRPLLREWLDAELPPLVEKLVRAEIARIAERG